MLAMEMGKSQIPKVSSGEQLTDFLSNGAGAGANASSGSANGNSAGSGSANGNTGEFCLERHSLPCTFSADLRTANDNGSGNFNTDLSGLVNLSPTVDPTVNVPALK